MTELLTENDLGLRRRPVGADRLAVSELGFGGGSLGNLYARIDDDVARATLCAALDGGIAYFDTAPLYGRGLSERRVGDALRSRLDVVISTKVGRILVPDPSIHDDTERDGYFSDMPFATIFDYTYDAILRSHEASLDRLGLATVDMLFVHDIGRAAHGDRHPHYWHQLTEEGGFRALEKLRDQGAIRAFGIGVNEIAICLEVLKRTPLDAILLAGRYTLLEQDALDEFFPACTANGTSAIIGAPYNSGILANGVRTTKGAKYNYCLAPPAIIEQVTRIERIADEYAVPVAAAALQFALAHPCVASVVPGLSSPKEVEASLRLLRQKIPMDFWREMRAAGLLREDAPVPQTSV